jgi:hypothetical protein
VEFGGNFRATAHPKTPSHPNGNGDVHYPAEWVNGHILNTFRWNLACFYTFVKFFIGVAENFTRIREAHRAINFNIKKCEFWPQNMLLEYM